MPSYVHQDVATSGEKLQRLWICAECGSVIGRNDQSRHDAWHAKLERGR